MQKRIQIGLIGDFNAKITTLVALNESIHHCQKHLPLKLEAHWIATEKITSDFPEQTHFDGLWIVPGSPYKNDTGVFELIKRARENNWLVYGTCGGFQYMLLEYARNVMQISDAGHEETEPGSSRKVISKLECSLKGQQELVQITDQQSWLFETLQADEIIGKYYCSYGLNPEYKEILEKHPLVFTAHSSNGEPRAFELKDHRFYAGTLFQPSLDSTPEKPNPLVLNFLTRCASESHGR